MTCGTRVQTLRTGSQTWTRWHQLCSISKKLMGIISQARKKILSAPLDPLQAKAEASSWQWRHSRKSLWWWCRAVKSVKHIYPQVSRARG